MALSERVLYLQERLAKAIAEGNKQKIMEIESELLTIEKAQTGKQLPDSLANFLRPDFPEKNK